MERYKAKLVENGYAQQLSVDYGETFSPVAQLDVVEAVLVVAAQNKWLVYQMDVKSAFPNGILEEEVYMYQPQVF